MQLSRAYFWALCALGISGLWVLAYFNGMFTQLDHVMQTRLLPDGRSVRDHYTGNAFLDEQLTLLAVFYGMLTENTSSGPRLLFFDINMIVSCTNLWVLIESRRRGTTNWLLKYPTWIMVLWNANGAAIFQPPFFWLLAGSCASMTDSTVGLADAISLLVCTIPIMLSPFLLFAPAWLSMETATHQGYIALFHAMPLVISGCLTTVSSFFSGRVERTNTRTAARASQKWIVASLVLAGIIAATSHLYTVTGALMTRDPDASFARIFLPEHGRANPAPSWIKDVPPTRDGLHRNYSDLLERFHLFSQYDIITVTLSCVLFVHLLLCDKAAGGDAGSGSSNAKTVVQARELGYLTVATIVLGPGAAGSFALAIREDRVQLTNRVRHASDLVEGKKD